MNRVSVLIKIVFFCTVVISESFAESDGNVYPIKKNTQRPMMQQNPQLSIPNNMIRHQQMMGSGSDLLLNEALPEYTGAKVFKIEVPNRLGTKNIFELNELCIQYYSEY